MNKAKLSSIKKFYFLDYFSIVLSCLSLAKSIEEAFELFKILKDDSQLGESRYKKISPKIIELSESQYRHYTYTFLQIIEETKSYNLIKQDKGYFTLTDLGKELLYVYTDESQENFNSKIFELMETKIEGFNYLIKACYKANPKKDGLLIFPIYSPLKLGILKSEIITINDIFLYTTALYIKLEEDIRDFLDKSKSLKLTNQRLITRLINSKLITSESNDKFDNKNYYKVVGRIRNFWLTYFLKEIYGSSLSLSYFDLWIYRAKQLGIFNAHEYYPGFNGKIIYPIAVLLKDKANLDFKEIFKYGNGEFLYIHSPRWRENQHLFVDSLFNSYHDLKNKNKSYFVNLADLRDIVCFKLKISDKTFNEFLKKAYLLNLKNQLKIKIALETDKLPEETKAIYLKREPVLISGKPKNIIAIDLKK